MINRFEVHYPDDLTKYWRSEPKMLDTSNGDDIGYALNIATAYRAINILAAEIAALKSLEVKK
jgi:hypothetical protein